MLVVFITGKVHWKDYYVHFLLAKGYDRPLAERHVVDYDQITLDPDCKYGRNLLSSSFVLLKTEIYFSHFMIFAALN